MTMISRRAMMKQAVAAAAGTLGLGMPPMRAFAGVGDSGIDRSGIKTKRVVFFLQNHGFDPFTCIPRDLKESCSLNDFAFQEAMKPLEPYKHMMHVVTHLHGRHTLPDHSAFFGALGGYRGGSSTPPAAATVDHLISQALPQTILPHLCIGMDSLENMKARPSVAALSAYGAGKPIYMHSDPNGLYQTLFGNVSGGDLNKRYHNRSDLMLDAERLALSAVKLLPETERARFTEYTTGLHDINKARAELVKVSDTLKKYAPTYDEGYTHPDVETDWHDRLLDIGIAALQANITNVLTIGSGRGDIRGSWKGIGVTKFGHGLGHMDQSESDIWVKIRQYNCRMLIKLIKSLEAVPEGSGTMMDNTLIVYGSNNAEKQHTRGNEWPFVLIGNGGGHFKTGVHTRVESKDGGQRPINDFYATILRGIGAPVDHFNLEKTLVNRLNSEAGPIENILA